MFGDLGSIVFILGSSAIQNRNPIGTDPLLFGHAVRALKAPRVSKGLNVNVFWCGVVRVVDRRDGPGHGGRAVGGGGSGGVSCCLEVLPAAEASNPKLVSRSWRCQEAASPMLEKVDSKLSRQRMLLACKSSHPLHGPKHLSP